MENEKLIFEIVVDDADVAVRSQASQKRLQQLIQTREKLTEARKVAKKQLQESLKAERELIAQKAKLKAAITQLRKDEASNRQEIGRLVAEYAQLTDKQKEARASADKYSEELQLAESNLKGLRSEINLTQKELQAVPGSISEQRVELSRLKKQWSEFRISIDGTQEDFDLLEKKINDITDELNEAEQGIQVFSRNVGNYKNSIVQAFNEMPGPVGRFTSSLSGLKDTFRQLKALGAGGLAVVGVAGIAAAGAAVANYGLELDKTREKVRQFSGEQGQALTELTATITATASAFNQEAGEISEATTALFKAYEKAGEDAIESQSAAGDIIRKTFAAGGDAAGELLELYKEYPSRLQEIGLSADQAAALIAQQPKTGVFSDKGIDVIQESLFRIREFTPATIDALEGIGLSSSEIQKSLEEGSTTAFEVVQKVSSKLSELPPLSSEVGTAIADIFGGPGEEAGLNYLTSLQNINLNLDELVENAGGAASANLRIAEATERINTQFLQLFEGSSNTFKELKASALEFAADGLEKIISGVVSLINYFIDLYNESALVRGAFEALGAIGKTVFTGLSAIIQNFFSIFKDIGKVVGAVLKGEFRSIPDIIKEGADERRQRAAEAGKEIAESWGNAFRNTVKREKVGLISLGADEVSEAEAKYKEAGKNLGKAFNEGFDSEQQGGGKATKKIEVDAVQNVSFSEISSAAIDLEQLAKDNNERLTQQKEYLTERLEQQKLFLEKERAEIELAEDLTAEERVQRATEVENQIRETRKQILELKLADLEEGSSEALEVELELIAIRKEAKDEEFASDKARIDESKKLEQERARLTQIGLRAVQN